MTIDRFAPPAFVAALVGLALVLGCGGGEDGAEKPAAQAEAPTKAPAQAKAPAPKKREQRPPRSAVSQLKDQVPLPADFPSDAPQYPGAWPSQVRNMPNGLMNVMFGSSDPAPAVVTWIGEFMDDNGWEVVEEQTMASGQVLRSEKGGRVLNIITSTMKSDDEDVTLIAVIVSPEG